MAKVIGYFEGSDSAWLTDMVALGHDTYPVSNGYDGHGTNVRLLNQKNRIDVIVGYMHKVVAPADWEVSTDELLHRIVTYSIPLILAVPAAYIDRAKARLGGVADKITIVDPADVVAAIEKVI